MIKYKKVKQEIEADVAEEVLCDKCNKNILSDCGDYVAGGNLMPSFGYGSRYDAAFNSDGDNCPFDICDDCYEEFLKFMGV